MSVSIGLVGSIDHDVLRQLAPHVEAAGFDTLWLNESGGADSLGGLAVAAAATTTLRLACGVIALDHRDAAQIVASVLSLGLPQERLTIGIGSGGPHDALRRVGDAVDLLHTELTAPVLVGALGPRMRRLAAERADGVLLNWLDPASAADATAELRHDAGGAPRRSVLYVRTALDEAARPALVAEAQRYGRIPSYAANLVRLGIDPMDASIDGSAALAPRLAEFASAVDEVVLRVVTATGSLAERRAFVDVAATAL